MKTEKYLEKVRLSVKRVSQLSVGRSKPKTKLQTLSQLKEQLQESLQQIHPSETCTIKNFGELVNGFSDRIYRIADEITIRQSKRTKEA